MTLATGGSPICVAIDDANVYWTDNSAVAVLKVSKAGGAVTTLATSTNMELLGALAIEGAEAYWMAGDGIRSVSTQGGTVTSMSTATVPSAKGFLRVILTRPLGPCVTRSCAMGGRRTYLQRASRPTLSMAPARVAAWRVKPSRLAQSGLS